ncbi:MAG: DUF4097 family beta strand repeat-containing protein [Acidobacteriota bacterium]
MRLFALLIASALVCLATEKIDIQRSGAAWKLTVTGSLPFQSISRIAVAGDLTVRGERSNDIRYTISQNVIAPDEATVRRLAVFFTAQFVNGQFLFAQPASVRIGIPRATRFLAVSSVAGTIDAADLDGSFRADAGAGNIILDRIAGDVEIHSNGGKVSLGSLGGDVRCYSGGGSIRAIRIQGQAYFETNGGDIQLGEVLGPVTALTAAGGIHIDQAGARVIADTLGGPISILRAPGMVIATSSGGPIDIGDATSVQCRSASGAIRLSNVSGSLRAATGRGSIVAEILSGGDLEDSFLSTRSGDITVLIPSDMGVTIEAESRGSPNRQPIVSDFSSLRIRHQSSSVVVALGEINGGGPRLRLTGVGGRIQIKRK